MLSQLCCTDCSSPLNEAESELRCLRCSRTFEVRGGIPVFSEAGDLQDLEEMRALIARLKTLSDDQFPHPSDHFRLPNRAYSRARRLSEEVTFSGFLSRFPSLRDKRILNISSGVGREANILLEQGARSICLLDISYEAVSHARRTFSRMYPNRELSYVVSDACALPFADSSFDLVVVYGSAHHYSDLKRFLSSAVRVAQHVILLAEPAMMGPVQPLLDRAGWNTEYGEIDTHRFEEERLKSAFAAVGLRCETERLSQYFPRVLDPVGDRAPVVRGWMALLRTLNRFLPRSMHHSLNAYGVRA